MSELAIVHNLYPDPSITELSVAGEISRERFTDKEIDMLIAFCSDLSFKEIAAAKTMSPRTVQGYRNILCNKIGVHSRIGLVLYAIRYSFVQV